MRWYLTVVRRYAVFRGRASRSEFWWFALWDFILSFALGVAEVVLDLGGDSWGPLTTVYSLALLIPTFAVGARRLHDTGRTGWWQALLVVPIVGIIVLIVWWAQDSVESANKWGARMSSAPEPA